MASLKLPTGVALLVLSVYLYVFYQETEILSVGLASVAMFGAGSYLAVRDIHFLGQFARVLPFIAMGATVSLALVALNLQTYLDDSSYSALLALASARVTGALIAMSGVKVQVSGNLLDFADGRVLSVGPLCSGAYSTVLFLLLSVVMVADVGRTAPKGRLAVAILVGALGANLANVLRITFLASVMYAYGVNALDVVHQFAGYAVFLGFMTAFWVLSLRWLASGGVSPDSRQRSAGL